MLSWLFSRPLQFKFLLGTILLVGALLPLLMLSVLQVLNPFLSDHIRQDMQDRTHILAMALMEGPAAHNQNDLLHLLQNVSDMHGYCYLKVRNTEGKLLATSGNTASKDPADSDLALDSDRNGCFDDSIPLLHDGKPFGMLHYGVDLGFVEILKANLRDKLFMASLLWLVLGATMYFLLVRRLVKPLQAITRASESMTHGNLNATLPTGLPQDELGKLATSFGNMATALRERIESQQQYARALYAEQAQLNALVSIMPVGVMFVDPERRVQHLNLECRQLWGISDNEDYVGHLDSELIAHARNLMEQPDTFLQHVETSLKEYGIGHTFDTPLRNGRIIRSRSCVVPDATGDKFIGRIWLFEDVAEEHARLREVQALADRDSLTGLYNRRRFEEDAECSFAQAQRNNRRLSLLYFDLDDFKRINDLYGHAAGDTILKGIARILSLQSRRNEELYRLDSDEFAILVPDAEQHQIEALARRVLAAVEKLQFSFGGQEVHVCCSMGIAACSPKSIQDSSADLMQQADRAMYHAKQLGKNRWHIYDPGQALDLDKNSR